MGKEIFLAIIEIYHVIFSVIHHTMFAVFFYLAWKGPEASLLTPNKTIAYVTIISILDCKIPKVHMDVNIFSPSIWDKNINIILIYF